MPNQWQKQDFTSNYAALHNSTTAPTLPEKDAITTSIPQSSVIKSSSIYLLANPSLLRLGTFSMY